jgi:peptide/nickel transport system permease protein
LSTIWVEPEFSVDMIVLLMRRLVSGVFVMWIVTLMVFGGTEILPGDLAQAVLGQNATEESLAAVRQRLGLDRPLHVRYVQWLRDLTTGSFGDSLASGRPIAELLGERVGNTLRLAACAALLAIPLAVGLGLLAAVLVDSACDRAISTISLCLMSVPEYFVAAVLVWFLAVQWHWLPVTATVRSNQTLLQTAVALVLPVLTLTMVLLAHLARMTRAAILNVVSSAYIEMATLKGATRWRIVLRHALPNALPPILNVVALNLAYLVSGVIVVETVFNYPGLANLMVGAVATHDLTLVQACAMIFCVTYVALNLIADLLAILANPRLRHPR